MQSWAPRALRTGSALACIALASACADNAASAPRNEPTAVTSGKVAVSGHPAPSAHVPGSPDTGTTWPTLSNRPKRRGKILSGANGGGGSINGNRLTVGLSVAEDDTTFAPAHHPSVYGPYYYRSYQFIPSNGTVGGSCPLPVPPGIGIVIIVETYERASGLMLNSHAVCIPAPQTGAPVVIPDAPPTIGDIWDAVTLANPTLGLSPATEGVTGLETWMWTTSPQTMTVDVAIGPWRVSGIATRTGFTVDTGEGPLITTTNGGSLQHPAATHLFEVKGNYNVAIASTWTATVTMSGPGITPRATNIGTAMLTAGQPYRVVEVRSVLTE